ncbi:MAG: FAD-dependent oxidoreductase [Melioribacteraceae bacterium]|nr:FAD-dependent oxidoreductase [Melioribacteraceae bacterium]
MSIDKRKKYKLDTGDVTYPFNILTALKDYDALSKSEKASVVKLFLKIAVCNPKHHKEISSKEFLEKNHQTQNSINALWEIIHVGTMNCKMEESSAAIFIRVLKEIFFTVNDSTKIILPKVGLSEMYCDRSAEFLEGKGAEISLSEKLIKIEFSDESGKAKALTTSKNRYTEFDYLVLAIPPDQLQRILPETEKFNLPHYEFSPILNIHLWLSENQFNERFYGLINSKIHWLFNKGKHITLVTSAADEFIPMSNEEILELVFKELSEYFEEFKSGYVMDHLIIKEKRATFKPTIENSVARQSLNSNYNNILLAGDWTNTGLPATIESAVKSGEAASDIISSFTQNL